MSLLNFRKSDTSSGDRAQLATFLDGVSIEVLPRTVGSVANFAQILPKGTRVYVAHIAGVPIEDMITTAARLRREGMEPVPHFAARNIADEATLADWIARYQGEADIDQGLILAGGLADPVGVYDSSMHLLQTGLFDKAGFTKLFIAGHPEGNKDIDPDGGDAEVMKALHWKQSYAAQTSAQMALTTQFCFAAKPVIAWAERLQAENITLPIHVGLAGPAKLQTLIKFAIACGVGPSLKVLQKRALDVSKLVTPYTPNDVAHALADHKTSHPNSLIEKTHLFPLGGIKASADWVRDIRQET